MSPTLAPWEEAQQAAPSDSTPPWEEAAKAAGPTQAPRPLNPAQPAQLPDASIQAAPAPGVLDRARSSVANSIVGRALGMEPTETEEELQRTGDRGSAPQLPEWANRPLLTGPDASTPGGKIALEESQQFRQAHPIAGGVAAGVEEVGKGLTSPANLALLAAAPESRIISAFFASQAAKGAYDSAEQAYQAFRQGKNAEAAKYATEAGLSGVVGALAGRHALTGAFPVDTGRPAVTEPVQGPAEPRQLGAGPQPEYQGEPTAPAQPAGIPDAEVTPWEEAARGQLPAKAGPTNDRTTPPPVNADTARTRVAPTQFNQPQPVPDRGVIVDQQGNALVSRPGLPPPGDTAGRKTPIIPSQPKPAPPVQTAPAPAPQLSSQATMVRPTVQASTVPEQVQSSAKDQQPALEKSVEQVASGVPGAELEGSRVKTADSIANKEDRGKPVETTTDVLGARVSAPEESQPQLEAKIEQQLPVVSKDKIDSNGLEATQYGVKTGAPGEPNQVSELQVVTPQQADAMKATDDLYDQQKKALAAGDKAKADELGEKIKAEFEGAKQEVAKGSRIQLADGRPGVVNYVDQQRSLARVTLDDGSKMPTVPLKALKPETKPPSGETQPEAKGDKWIGVDLDGTLAHYDGFKGKTDIGAPIPAMVERVRQWLKDGNNVKILTARVSDDAGGEAKKAIEDWTEQHLGQKLDVTDVKDSHMTHLYDDRAVPVERNTGKLLAQPQPEKDQAVTPQVAQSGTEPAKVGQPDRRVNRAERQRVDQMSPEEMRRTLLTSDKTGLPNRRAFDEAQHENPAAMLAMSDADGLKAFNDRFGYAAGDELLRAKADALREAGLDAYHDKGDEFLYRGGDDLGAKLDKAREILRQRVFDGTEPDGKTVQLQGVDFSYGTGSDLKAAESALKGHKSEREARGERARGELGPGVKVTRQNEVEGQTGKEPTAVAGSGGQTEVANVESGNRGEPRAADETEGGREQTNAIRKPSPEGLLQRQPEEAGKAGRERGRVEPGEQGQEPAREGAAEEEPLGKPVGGQEPQALKKGDRVVYEGKPAIVEDSYTLISHSLRQGVPSTERSAVDLKTEDGYKFDVDPKKITLAGTVKPKTPQIAPLAGSAPLGIAKTADNISPPEQKPVNALINAIYDKLAAGESLGNVTELNKLGEKHLGASRTSGEWTPKDLFDAMEAAVNKYLLKIGKGLMEMPAVEALAKLRALMSRLTSQGTRTEDQIKNQQFSTPPTESYVVARVAALKPSDVVLEPSAGNGGLAVWPKAIGAEVHVNEIAARRQEMLEAAGFGKPTAVDGELINALLPTDIKPTVVLMNPPFSASTLKSYEAKNQSRYGFNHVEQALQRLAPGGRLVAILGGGREGFQGGEGASLRIGEAGKWFDKIAKEYNVRANIRVDGREYAKYGTSYATRIIVIDKDGPTPSKALEAGNTWNSVIEKNVDTLEEAYNALKPVEESRPSNAARPTDTDRPARRPAPSGVGPDTGPGVPSVRTPAGGSGRTPGEVPAPVRSDRPGPSPATSGPKGGGEQLPVHRPGSEAGRGDEGQASPSAGAGPSNGDTQRQVAERGLDLEREEAKSEREEEDESAYATYQPTIKGAKHPGSIVETKSMATVPMPPITYKPDLPAGVVGKAPDYENAKLSAVQLEAVAIAGMQNDILLPGGFRASALIGDGTGVGKGREGAAILWDNWRKGRRRLVWMTKSKDLIVDAIRDLEGIGATDLAKSIKNLGKLDASTPIDHQGILFTTYALFRSGDKKGNTRAAQIDKWLRGTDGGEGGYLLMDESHNLKNAVVSQGGQASQIGQAVKTFLEKMPPLRTVSLSATAATDVMNLGYLDRLGLWGPGTPFPNGFNQFAGEIAHGGMSAMEMIARELKAQGKYVSRTLTYRGVKYSEIEHEITPDQKAIYASAAKAWRDVFNSAEHTINTTTGGGARQKAMAMSQFFSAQQRFFNLLLTSIKIPTAVKEAEAALARGESVAITLVNTNEAAQNREKDRVAADDSGEEPDYDFGPGKMISDLVMEHYPTQQYKDDVDSNGNPIKVPVVDAKGNPVQNPQAIAARDKLLNELSQLKMPANPLDELIELLGGPSKVAELTGRKQRYDSATNRLVNRGGSGVAQDKVNKAEEAAFQAGRKRVAILSSAADTGISLHSDKGAKNQQKRFVITLQVGWSADKAMQMNGRFNRSNQANAPEYALLKTNLGGESRFISSIARRMESLEALSKGQTKTNTGTEAMSKVNFETDQGRAASVAFYNSLLQNREVPGALDAKGEPLSGREILKQLRVLKGQSGGGETVPPADRANITRLLNRLLALDPDVQQPVYNYFYDIFDATVKRAEADGTLDTGVKRLPGDSFEIKEQRELSADPATGAKTFYYPIDSKVRVYRMSAELLKERFEKLKKSSDHPVIMRGPKGELALMADAKPIVHSDGRIQDAVHVMTPDSYYAQKQPASKYSNWKAVDADARDKVDKAEKAIEYAQHDIDRYTKLLERENLADYNKQYYQEELATAKKEKEAAVKAYKDGRVELRKLDPVDIAREDWQKQFEAAPDHEIATHHLIGGAVMRFWNPIREASGHRLDVFSAVDAKSGDRVVGIEIPPSHINSLLGRIAGGKSTVNANQIMDDVLKNATQYDLEGGIKIRRGRVAGTNVVQFVTANSDVQSSLKNAGVLYERGMQPVYYLPTGDYGGWSQKGEEILKKVLEQYPAKVAGGEDASEEAPKKSGLDTTFYSGGFLDPELFKVLFPDIAQRVSDWATEKHTPGAEQRAMMRETRGERDRMLGIVAKKLEGPQRSWIFRSRDDSKAFFNAVESGQIDTLPSRDQALAKLFRGAFDQMRGELQDLNPNILADYIENYFPHIWQRPSMAAQTIRSIISGKRPFAGKGSFLKQRTIPTIQDGLDMGLTPVSWNPVDLFLRKYSEMGQFLMAQKTLKMMKEAGTVKMVRIGEKAPEGWQRLDDRIGQVHSYDDEGHLYIRANYFAPPDAAKVFNNYVSRGLAGRSGIYDTLRWANNNLNSLQLGISAFHASTTAINAATSEVALGIQQLFEGKPFTAAGHFLSGGTIAPSVIRTMVNGSRMMREYLDPGSYKKMEAEASAVAEAGGRARMDMVQMKALDKTINAFRNGSIGEGLLSLPGTVLQTTIAPVMDWMVPRMKLGAFYDMAHDIFDQGGRNNWSEEQIRGKLQRAWDSIDNRFGQLVYENLFWHKGLQDTLMLASRSVGWNFGDLRELGGAAADVGKQAAKAATGKMPEVTPRMAFAFALPLVTGLVGAVLTYLWTGQKPDTWKDYFYPKRKDGTRVSIPGYMKDVIAIGKHPIDTIVGKMSPLLSLTAEAINNRDFYGTEIRHKDDPPVKQMIEVAKWAGAQATPFSFSGTKKLLDKKGADTSTVGSTLKAAAENLGEVALGQLGFQPAPASIQNSAALNKAREYEQENRPSGTKTAEEAKRTQAMHTIEDMYHRGDVHKETIDAMKAQGVLREQDILRARLYSRTDPLTRAVRSLTGHPEQILNVYKEADPGEQKLLRPLVEAESRKLQNMPLPAEQKDALRKAFRDALNPGLAQLRGKAS